jgi:hypothetical protein
MNWFILKSFKSPVDLIGWTIVVARYYNITDVEITRYDLSTPAAVTIPSRDRDTSEGRNSNRIPGDPDTCWTGLDPGKGIRTHHRHHCCSSPWSVYRRPTVWLIYCQRINITADTGLCTLCTRQMIASCIQTYQRAGRRRLNGLIFYCCCSSTTHTTMDTGFNFHTGSHFSRTRRISALRCILYSHWNIYFVPCLSPTCFVPQTHPVI